MRSVILSLATRLWGCNPEFEKVGEPETNALPDSGGGSAEGEQDVGVVDSYTDVQRDSGKTDTKDDAGKPGDKEDGPVVDPPDANPPDEPPPRNEPPTFVGIVSPNWESVVVPNAADQYEFIFECHDTPNDLVQGAIFVWKDDNDGFSEDDIIINPYDPPLGTSSVDGDRVKVRVPAQNIPPLSLLCWAPYTCEDRHGNETFTKFSEPTEDLVVDVDWSCFETLDKDVVHYWSFDAIERNFNGDRIVVDRTESRKDGVIFNNASVRAGVQGDALQCDGVDDYVQTPEPVPVGIANTWTISWWQFLDRTDGHQQLFTLRPDNPGSQRNLIEAIAGQSEGDPDYRRIIINYIADNGNSLTFGTRDRVLNTGTWEHIAMVHGGTRQSQDPCNLNLYINGAPTAFAVNPNPSCSVQASFDRFIDLCRQFGRDDRYLRGRIDEFVIRDRAMSRQEILKEYERNSQE